MASWMCISTQDNTDINSCTDPKCIHRLHDNHIKFRNNKCNWKYHKLKKQLNQISNSYSLNKKSLFISRKRILQRLTTNFTYKGNLATPIILTRVIAALLAAKFLGLLIVLTVAPIADLAAIFNFLA